MIETENLFGRLNNIQSKNFNTKVTIKEKQYDLQAVYQTGFRELVHQIRSEVEKIKKALVLKSAIKFDQQLVSVELVVSTIESALVPANPSKNTPILSSVTGSSRMASSKHRSKRRDTSKVEAQMFQGIRTFDLAPKYSASEKKASAPYRSRSDMDNQEALAIGETKDLKDNSKQQGGKKILLSYFSSHRESGVPNTATSQIPNSSKQLLKASQADDTASRSVSIKPQARAKSVFKLMSFAIGFFVRSFKSMRNVSSSNRRN